MPKEKTISLAEAAEAFILLHDSGNYNGRRYHRVLGMLRDAVKGDSKLAAASGPIMPDDERPDLDEDQEQAVEERVWASARVDDLVHPGGRMQRASESIDTIIEKAKEGTLADDEARRTAKLAKGEDPDDGSDGKADPNASNRPRAQRKRATAAKKKAAVAKKSGGTSSVSTSGTGG